MNFAEFLQGMGYEYADIYRHLPLKSHYFAARIVPRGIIRDAKNRYNRVIYSGFSSCRGNRIRTCDPLLPKQVR